MSIISKRNNDTDLLDSGTSLPDKQLDFVLLLIDVLDFFGAELAPSPRGCSLLVLLLSRKGHTTVVRQLDRTGPVLSSSASSQLTLLTKSLRI